MVSECYSVLVEAERAGLLELLHFEAEPACWRSFVGRRGSSEVLKPDSLVRVGLADYEDHWFLECDRSTEDLGRIGRKIGGYIRYWQAGKEDPFPRVLWVCARPERAGALAGVVRRLPPINDVFLQLATLSCSLSASGMEPTRWTLTSNERR